MNVSELMDALKSIPADVQVLVQGYKVFEFTEIIGGGTPKPGVAE